MSRSINDSVQLLTETLGNCKTALTEKQVADVDNIKISDVDEKIAEITAGGGAIESPVEISSVKWNNSTDLENGKKTTVSRSSGDVTINYVYDKSKAQSLSYYLVFLDINGQQNELDKSQVKIIYDSGSFTINSVPVGSDVENLFYIVLVSSSYKMDVAESKMLWIAKVGEEYYG